MDSEVERNAITNFANIGNLLLSSFLYTFKGISFAFRFLLVFGVVFIKNFRTTYSTAFGDNNGETEADETVTNNNQTKLSNMDEIKLKIGGKCFETSAEILKRFDSFFSRMIESDLPHKIDENGCVVVERDGTHFEKILKFMRTGDVEFPSDPYVVRCIRHEADFYQLEDLIKQCDKFLDGPEGRYEACLRAVFTLEERSAAIATKKPIVFLAVEALSRMVVFDVNSNKAVATGLSEFIKNRIKFPQFFFIMDYTHGSSLTTDFYFDGALVQKLDIYAIQNNQCTMNIEYLMSSAFTNVMAKMLDSAGFGRAVKEDGQLALTL